jgi:hypothetical protein
MASGLGSDNLQGLKYKEYRALPQTDVVIREANHIEDLLRRLIADPNDVDWELHLGRYPKLKALNSFGTQIVIRMLRSGDRFRGYKVDFDNHALKPYILFLVGTLSDDFSHMNTSPLNGVRALDVGCGALSEYGTPLDTNDLLAQFYAIHPPILPEILQMLGATTFGVDPRENSSQEFEYQVTYKHMCCEFPEISTWMQKLPSKFDLISCFNLFSRRSFNYLYQSPDEIADFFAQLRRGLNRQGLLYTSAPLIPSSSENRQMNRRIFAKAGFKIVYEGYYFILEPLSRITAEAEPV